MASGIYVSGAGALDPRVYATNRFVCAGRGGTAGSGGLSRGHPGMAGMEGIFVLASFGLCGNQACDCSETRASCPGDCFCGNGACEADEDVLGCPGDCFCDNGTCDEGETALGCLADCWCGDGVCDPSETAEGCPGDCQAP
jgi:hypothetical protein